MGGPPAEDGRALTTETQLVVSEGQTDEERIFVEPRWPIALALSAYIVISITLRIAEPTRESLGPHWLIPSIEIALLGALIAADPRPHQGPVHTAGVGGSFDGAATGR